MKNSGGGIEFAPDGQVVTGETFKKLDVTWSLGIAAMARAGANIIIDDVFLDQTASQDRWRSALDGLDVLWVGVRCDGSVAESREMTRGDRVVGMARSQAELVHRGVHHDLEVDTSTSTPQACARMIADAITTPRG